MQETQSRRKFLRNFRGIKIKDFESVWRTQNQDFCGLPVYYRLYTTCAPAGFLFDVGQSTVWGNIRHLKPLVKERIPIPEKMEDKMGKIRGIDELLKLFPGLEVFVDAALNEIPGQEDKQKKKRFILW